MWPPSEDGFRWTSVILEEQMDQLEERRDPRGVSTEFLEDKHSLLPRLEIDMQSLEDHTTHQ